MDVAVEQADQGAVDLAKREGLLPCITGSCELWLRQDDLRFPGSGQRVDEDWQKPNPDRPVWIPFTQLQAASDFLVALSKMRGWLRSRAHRLAASIAVPADVSPSDMRPLEDRVLHAPILRRAPVPPIPISGTTVRTFMCYRNKSPRAKEEQGEVIAWASSICRTRSHRGLVRHGLPSAG